MVTAIVGKMIMTIESAANPGPRFASGVDAILGSGLIIKGNEMKILSKSNRVVKLPLMYWTHSYSPDCKVADAA